MKLQNPMTTHTLRVTALLSVLMFLPPAMTTHGQLAEKFPEPRREQLLNGLKVLFWNRPGDAQVLLKLRIHSGAAFDLDGKEGLMALLGDALFPDSATRQYVTEDLGGKMVVSTDYDAINVTLTGRAAEFERLVELLRNATVSTRLTPETVTQLREARIKVMRDVSLAPEVIADRAISARLYGSYPYGRLMTGSPESLARIDRADLMLARERFLNPNNATLVCIGGVEPARALRAVRQFLGVWRRSERVIPATFRQPEKPGQPTLIINLAGAPDVEARLALRGVARTDRAAAAAAVLPLLVRDRWRALAPQLKDSVLSVRHDAYAIGGVFRMSAAVRSSSSAATAFEAARKTLDEFVTTPPTPAALENAKRETLAALNQNVEMTEVIAEAWLDAQTYNSEAVSTPELTRSINSLSPADIQRIAARLFRDAPVVAVAVGDETKLRNDLARSGSFEVLGAASDPKTKSPASTAPRAPSAPELRMRRP